MTELDRDDAPDVVGITGMVQAVCAETGLPYDPGMDLNWGLTEEQIAERKAQEMRMCPPDTTATEELPLPRWTHTLLLHAVTTDSTAEVPVELTAEEAGLVEIDDDGSDGAVHMTAEELGVQEID